VDTLGIAPGATLAELGPDEEKKVRDAIFMRVDQVATDENFCHTLWGTIYESTNKITGPRDIREYAAMLNACGKLRKPEIGFAAALGDRVAYNEALGLLRRYQEQMVRVLGWFNKNMNLFKVTPQVRYIYAGKEVEPTMIGEALSLAMESGLVATDMPVIGMADAEDDELKISARATLGLVMHGLNLGDTLTKVAADVGGDGGGHDVSAAARIQRERMDEFMTKLNKALAEAGGA